MPYVRPDVASLLAMINSQPGPKLHEGEPAAGRDMMRTMASFADLPRGDIARVADIVIPGPDGQQIPARLYSDAAVSSAGPVLLFFHGGGWVIGDLDTYDSLCAEIARGTGLTLVSVGYRLAPEHPFPAGVDDCLAAARWAATSPAAIGHAVTGLVVAGDSAGGNLAALCAQTPTDLPILVQWLIYPAVDMTAKGGSMVEFAENYLLSANDMAWFSGHYFGDLTDRADLTRASPLLADTLAGLPAALVFTCGLDPLRDQGRAYAARLVENGVPTRFREAAGQVHGCFNLRQIVPSAQNDLAACLADLKAMVAEAVSALPATRAEAAE